MRPIDFFKDTYKISLEYATISAMFSYMLDELSAYFARATNPSDSCGISLKRTGIEEAGGFEATYLGHTFKGFLVCSIKNDNECQVFLKIVAAAQNTQLPETEISAHEILLTGEIQGIPPYEGSTSDKMYINGDPQERLYVLIALIREAVINKTTK